MNPTTVASKNESREIASRQGKSIEQKIKNKFNTITSQFYSPSISSYMGPFTKGDESTYENKDLRARVDQNT